MKKLLILGATGSIGTTTINELRKNPHSLKIVGLTAFNKKEELIKLGKEFNAKTLILNNENDYLPSFIEETKPDIILNGISGSMGLRATLDSIDKKVDVALANKESIVMGGEFLKNYAKNNGVKLIPVDSEHSAIFNLLKQNNNVDKLLITASGGPFLKRKNLENITVEEALEHPTWKMGKKITIDSATLANKGLEVIEAHYLFGFPPEKIEVVIHPESIIHSMVKDKNGAIYAQLSYPDMTLPIFLALLDKSINQDKIIKGLDFSSLSLHFEKPDFNKFQMLKLAYDSLSLGASYPIAYNASNEVLVDLFLNKKIQFLDISYITKKVLNYDWCIEPKSYFEIMDLHKRAKKLTESIVNSSL